MQVSNVTFAYPTRPEAPVFTHLSLTVPAEKVLAIVGSSGSGKSTLASLILRYYEPQSGSIFVGGENIAHIDPYWLRQHVGTVSQEPVLFSTSVRDNIVYGAVDPTNVCDRDVEEAAREANAHDFIIGFPRGYDTPVGERGVMLSGGQKQRVAIARAILRRPKILLLDEATSALDAASEHQVKEALARIMSGRTVITIAHRLSTILHAGKYRRATRTHDYSLSVDKIVVLKDGTIIEEGTYDSLTSVEDGYFKQLVTKQTVRK